MSKNPTILEGGIAKVFNGIKRLYTRQSGSNEKIPWVPESECTLGTKYITQNGVYKAEQDGVYAYSSATVNVPTDTGVTGEGEDGEQHYVAPDPETGELVDTILPYRIAVENPPTKTDYIDGEPIDFTGLVVKAYREDGALWTNDLYPDGIVPLNELSFPVTVAECNENPISFIDAGGYKVPYGYPDTPNTKWSEHVTPSNWAFCIFGKSKTPIYSEYDYYHYHTPANPTLPIRMEARYEQSGEFAYWYLPRVDGGYYWLNRPYGYEVEEWDNYAASNWLYTETETHYVGIVFSGRYKTIVVDGQNEYEIDAGSIGIQIPVCWSRYNDGFVLETEFTITVTPATSGQGDITLNEVDQAITTSQLLGIDVVYIRGHEYTMAQALELRKSLGG